jgi:hypothetical protein
MKEITVNIEGTEYTIDIEKAKSLGILKDKTIKDFKVGDVYLYNDRANIKIIIVESGYCDVDTSHRWNIAGLDHGLRVYSDFGSEGASKKQMLEYLNDGPKKFIKNINEDIKSLMRNL